MLTSRDNRPVFISYRQGGERYKDILSSSSAPLSLSFNDGVAAYAQTIWDQLSKDAKFSQIDLKAIFQNDNPCSFEIGIGNGEFIAEKVLATPNENFIGVEVFKDVFIKAHNRIRKAGVKNAKIIQFDAALILRLLPDLSLKNIYVNFPDPWPKKAHKKRRLLKPDFIEQLASKLYQNALLNIATDHDGYALEIEENIVQVSSLKSTFKTVSVRALDGYLPTKYYRKFIADNKPYFFIFQKL